MTVQTAERTDLGEKMATPFWPGFAADNGNQQKMVTPFWPGFVTTHGDLN